MGIIGIENNEQVEHIAAEDPAVKSVVQRLEIYPMFANFRERIYVRVELVLRTGGDCRDFVIYFL